MIDPHEPSSTPPDAGRSQPAPKSGSLSSRLAGEVAASLKTLASAAVYATLIVTFGFQVARVEGHSMADDSFVGEENKSHDDWRPGVVPEGFYFVMGDHRSASFDSRHWRFVPKRYIIGRVQLRWWPMADARPF